MLVNDKYSQPKQVLIDAIRDSWHVSDGGLVTGLNESGHTVFSSERVFIDNQLSAVIGELFPDAEKHLTYFVNSISHGNLNTPYSFVTATNRSFNGIGVLNPGEVIVNSWLANDLQLKPGDTIDTRYFIVGPRRELEQATASLVVKGVIPIEESARDGFLMPDIPGMSDAGDCNEWDAGIPIDLGAIRPEDEQYWDSYRGTPKAYISLQQGSELWQNRFGNLTSIIVSSEQDVEAIENKISGSVNPFALEFQLNPVREQGIKAARGGVDFSQLFAGLGMFIVFSGLILTALLLNLSLKMRDKQIKLLVALGFPVKRIFAIFMAEAVIITIIGALAGLLLSMGYSRLLVAGLNQAWHDIVRMDVITLSINIFSLLPGVVAGIGTGLVVSYFGIRASVYRLVGRNDDEVVRPPSTRPTLIKGVSYIFFIIFIALSVSYFTLPLESSILIWFIAGLSLLVALISISYSSLNSFKESGAGIFNSRALALKNLRRNPARSFMVITLLALGSFVIVLTALNRVGETGDPSLPGSGTGGFMLVAESTLPVFNNLNTPEQKEEHGIPEEVNFVQFFTAFDDDASCLNLNRVQNPRVLATDPAKLTGRFSFVSGTSYLNPENPWESLNGYIPGVIPAIADQTVIQWGMGLNVGDTLNYINARGENVKLLLVGGLANSVFQGNVIISEKHFLEHFSAAEGSGFALVEAPYEMKGELKEILDFRMREQGWVLVPSTEKLAEFNSVQNVYLNIFSLLGAIGLLIGTVGLAAIIAKSMIERKREIALMTALGFKFGNIFKMVFQEFSILFAGGLFIGTAAAFIATLPTLLDGGFESSLPYIGTVLAAIVLNGIFWICMFAIVMVRRLSLPLALRDE